MKIRKLSVGFFASLVMILGLSVAGCGDDTGLDDRFDPTTKPEDLGDASPITVDTKLGYMVTWVYRPISGNEAGGGSSLPELQGFANLCIRVDEVKDTATKTYKNAAETLVTARVKVNGGAGQNEIYVQDDVNPAPTNPTLVDAAHGALWLRKLTFPQSRDHGYLSPKSTSFHTRSSISPTKSLTELPFFEVRTYEDGWRGWTDFLSKLYVEYFTNVLAVDFMDKKEFNQSQPQEAPATCVEKTDAGTCGSSVNCYWDPDLDKCWGINKLNMAWRETLTTGPAELLGPVIHALEMSYTSQGTLRFAQEFIVPDLDPTANVPTNLRECIDGQPCATAVVDRDEWESRSCTF